MKEEVITIKTYLSRYSSVYCESNKCYVFNAITGKKAILENKEAIYNDDNGYYLNLDLINQESILSLQEIGCFEDESKLKDIIDKFIKNDYTIKKTLSIIIIPTHWCNFTCRYCYQEHESYWMNNEILDSIILYLSKNILNFEHLDLGWFGGEPLCALDQLLKASRKINVLCYHNNISMFSSMSTNGYLLTPNNFSKLYKHGVFGFQITLDGFEDMHNKFRCLSDGSPTFKQIIENLIYIRDNKQYSKAVIIIRINISSTLWGNLKEFLEYLSALFGGDTRFSIDLQKIKDLGGKTINEIKEELIDYDLSEYIELLRKLNLGTDRYHKLINIGGNVCKAARKNSYVFDYDGTVKKCTAALDDPINVIGKIEREGSLSIDAGKEQLWISDKAESGCYECAHYPLCFVKACPYSKIRFNKTVCPKQDNLIQMKC